MAGITGFVGPNGHGKTLCMMERLVVPAIEQKIEIVANFRIFSDLWTPLTSWLQLLELHGCLVLFDEITSVLPSREAMRAPAQLIGITNQLRKQKCRVGWSAPAWARADVALREVTQDVWVCKGFATDRKQRDCKGTHHFPFSGPSVGKSDPLWPPKRLFRWDCFDATALDEFTYGRIEREQIKRVAGQWYWRPGHVAHQLYDTEERVLMMDHLDDVGLCIRCGGTKRRHACKCDPMAQLVGR